jgi:photosystem II stability/assembly factor-like uncharacterized protein
MIRRLCIAAVLSLTAAAPAAAGSAPAPVTLEPKLFKSLAFRSIGPANMSGRITDFAVDEANPWRFYMATATGGAFKTENRGVTWTPVFEKEAVSSVGAIALWPKNANVVWIGTGEANNRNSSSWGRGVWRSLDGGGSWTAVGLDATSAIGRIVCDPRDSNTVYVAALGRLWGANPERGVFKTRDGGRTWEHVLRVDANTGAVDLVMDPSDPNVLYAAMYARRRTAWSYTGTSETGGIFRTADGGRTWTKLVNGLPRRTGRIGLCVYAKNPRVVYAVVESDEGGRVNTFEEAQRAGGVFRSDDAGASWRRLSPFAPRAFYFSQIRVQPDDSTRVYLLGTDLYVSDDGGHTFRGWGARALHPDGHAMWVEPSGGRHVLLGTDGGAYQSFDRGATWDFLDNLALGQFYNVAADLREPYYHVYGGLQDNQSWGGPSRTRFEVQNWLDEPSAKGILEDHWFVLGGGDGFHVAVDPTDPDIVYYESQGGNLVRQHLGSGRERYLRPAAAEGEPAHRFNWNTPFQISPHDPSVLWMGGQYVFRLTQRGDRWERVSPDLTTQDPRKMAADGSGAEQHCTITTLAESPLRAGLVWAGTDDGKVWVTTNGGGAWLDLTSKLRGVPAGLYVSRIEPSNHEAHTAYVAFDGHRSDVFEPYVLVTRDLGQSWTSLAAGLPAGHPVKVVREGRRNRDLLFAGTEFGLWCSLDAGRRWMPLGEGLPTVPVDDLLIHPRDGDLIVGTHGRSLFVLDGIQAFEQWSARCLEDTVTFFAPRPAWTWYKRELGGHWGQSDFAANNPPFGAWFDYFLPRELEGGVTITVTDSAGRTVRTLKGGGSPGLNRVTWDLVPGEPRTRIAREEHAGQPQFVRPGAYRATLRAGKARPIERSLSVKTIPAVYDEGP